MQVAHLGGGCGGAGCPTLYATDRGTYLVQGYQVPGRPDTVAVPRSLVAGARVSGAVRSPRADTLFVTGKVVPSEGVEGLRIVEKGEALVEVPMSALTPRAVSFEFTRAELDAWTSRNASLLHEAKGVNVAL